MAAYMQNDITVIPCILAYNRSAVWPE